MISAIRLLIFFTLSCLAVTGTSAQTIVTRQIGGGPSTGQPIILMEVGAVVSFSDGKLTVEHMMQKDRLPKVRIEGELKEGDAILMANAKKIMSTKDLEELYKSLPVGQEMKLGVQRGEEKFIVTFEKANPKDLPKMQIKIGSGSGGDMEVLPAVGVVLKSQGKKIVVDGKLPDSTSALANANIRKNDEIFEMNNKPYSSLKNFVDRYMEFPVGSKVEWKVKRGKETVIVSFSKPKPRQQMIRREINN